MSQRCATQQKSKNLKTKIHSRFNSQQATMSPLLTPLYILLLHIINTYKSIELKFLTLISPYLIPTCKTQGHSIGLVLHSTTDEELTEKETTRILATCKYDKLMHLNIKDNTFYARIMSGGSLAFAETYMEGLWDFCGSEDDITEVCKRLLEKDMMDLYWNWWNRFLEWVETSAFNLQTGGRAFQVGKVHYDLGNDLYKSMLDPHLQYTCGYWSKADNLNDAQLDKMKLIANKLDLKPGMRVLDIGCGWGTLCKYLAENHKVQCVGVTISEEGVNFGKDLCTGLPVDIRLQDYRDLNEKFDRIVSVGMFEHVGFRNYRDFFKVVRRCLEDDGLFLLHTIGREHSNIPRSELFLHRYIFPNGNLPSPKDLTSATSGLFIMEDWHNFGLDYAKTLESWRCNFINSWGSIGHNYGDKFYRMWVYYLSFCAGMFKARRLQVYQIVYSNDGLKRGYRAVR